MITSTHITLAIFLAVFLTPLVWFMFYALKIVGEFDKEKDLLTGKTYVKNIVQKERYKNLSKWKKKRYQESDVIYVKNEDIYDFVSKYLKLYIESRSSLRLETMDYQSSTAKIAYDSFKHYVINSSNGNFKVSKTDKTKYTRLNMEYIKNNIKILKTSTIENENLKLNVMIEELESLMGSMISRAFVQLEKR